jgi:DNA mismatch repair protein MutS2
MMDAKSIQTLELPKILERLSKYTSFSAGTALALALIPTEDFAEAQRRQQETTEARKLLAVKTDVTIGGACDIRPQVHNAARGGVLMPAEMMDVKNTLLAGRTLHRILSKLGDQFPRLAFIASGIEETPGIVEAIGRTLDERGEVLDSASEKLAVIRRELRLVHDRLLQKLQRLITDPRHAAHLQEHLITQRDGRYVIPLKADFKGRIRGIVHDQSASGQTLFIEPLATVELNNELREKQLAEQEEIRRIMAALSALVGEQADKIIRLVEAVADLDVAFAKAKYAEAIRASEPVLREFRGQKSEVRSQNYPFRPLTREADLQPPTPTTRIHPGSTIKLRAARHPLLHPDTVVPIDVELDDETYALVITGPNTGGKTVSLKTVGLLAMMAQCGLHLPAQSGSEVSVFPKIFADIGDEQSIEQSLSTFSAHITNIIRILKQVDDRTLILIDELGSGTDPAEGSALARAILSYLLDLGATALVATHYPELKGYAHHTPGVQNASVEFDLNTLAPTYHLTIGLPGRSNAFAIATRLGLEKSIIDEARAMVGEADLQAEQLLDEIHRQRETVRAERARAEAARRDAEEHERAWARRMEHIEDERRQILEKARAEAQKELDALREELGELKRTLARAAQPVGAFKEVEEKLEEAEARHALPIAPLAPSKTGNGKSRPIRLGDTVKLKTLNSIGVVTALTTVEAEVQVGRMRVRAKLDELALRGSAEEENEDSSTPPPQPPAKKGRAQSKELAPSPGLELDVRGKTVDEAVPELERYLDAAYYAGLPWVRVIHGKGTGKLRQGLREFLRSSPLVKSHKAGEENEGGEGVTVVKLALEN